MKVAFDYRVGICRVWRGLCRLSLQQAFRDRPLIRYPNQLPFDNHMILMMDSDCINPDVGVINFGLNRMGNFWGNQELGEKELTGRGGGHSGTEWLPTAVRIGSSKI